MHPLFLYPVTLWGAVANSSWLHALEEQWEKPPLGRLLVSIGIAMSVYWLFRTPPSNYSLIAMAVAAGLMALRPDMSGRERSLWAVVIILFAIIEIRAINKDKVESDKRRDDVSAQEQANFKTIGDDIRDAIKESQRQFGETTRGIQATIERTDRNFRQAAAGFQETVNVTMGGNSFCYIVLGTNSNPPPAYVVHRGKYPLSGVSATIIDNDKAARWASQMQNVGNDFEKIAALSQQMMNDSDDFRWIGDLNPNSPGPRIQTRAAYLEGDHRNISVLFSARNGGWIESYGLRLVNGRWLQSIQVVPNQGSTKPLLVYIDQGYPESTQQKK